jgi:hypothetical protein
MHQSSYGVGKMRVGHPNYIKGESYCGFCGRIFPSNYKFPLNKAGLKKCVKCGHRVRFTKKWKNKKRGELK